MMKKMFAVLALATVTVVACAGKKPSTAPPGPDSAPLEKKDDATGGAAYGGRKSDAQPDKPMPTP
jgi:hypothetical protein